MLCYLPTNAGQIGGQVPLDMIMRNITLAGGVDPARHYIDGISPDVLEGRIEPGRVFDRTVGLDGYRPWPAASPSMSSSPHDSACRAGRI